MKDMKAMAQPFLVLYAMALVVALLGRAGLAVAGGTGVLAFDYISASGVPVLDVICSILTGSAFVAFLFAAGLALCVSTAGAVLYGALASRAEGDAGAPAVRPRPLTAFLWGWATALVALVCLMIVALGILSAVQVGSMSSKLPGLPIIVVGVIGFAAFLGTLLGAASMVVCACVARWRAGHSLEMALVVAVALCGRRSAHGRHVLGPERGEHQPAGAGRLVRGGCRGKCGHALRCEGLCGQDEPRLVTRISSC